MPCTNLAGPYDLQPSGDKCVIVPIPFGTQVFQNGCFIRFSLRLDSGSATGQIHGNSIDFVWTNTGCQPDLVGSGTFEPNAGTGGAPYQIRGTVAGPADGESPFGSCCTRIDFKLVPQ